MNNCSSDPKIQPANKKLETQGQLSDSNSPATLIQHPSSLNRERAIIRSKMITQVAYHLEFNLLGDPETFQAKASIQFDLKPKSKDLNHPVLLDLEGGKILSIQLNDKLLTDSDQSERFDGHHIYFNPAELKASGNRVEISYTHPYSHDGRGLHRFEDPVDKKSYLFSNFEPYDAHRMFPCFDQPDLKATYELTVAAPSDWQVISNTLPASVTDSAKGKSWSFPKSQTFSTYLFALHAGPYSVWKGQADAVPIRLFARKSLEKFVDHAEWLKITEQGLDYFGSEFGYPYPFGKYDQILVPDFNSGAMENVGAVTFSESFVFRSRVTQDQRRRRANTILHEMAHMWFGDLVTMKWWNGLWLNESFATFMATRAVDQATEFKGSWQDFFSGNKQWAYWEDQMVTTHPIENPVLDTSIAESIFDGITYGKGASVLKQLQAYLGEDEFREGLQRYFQKYAFKNTSIGDFFKKLSEASGVDLGEWEKKWLHTSGVNTLRADWKCQLNPDTNRTTITQLDLIQSTVPSASSGPSANIPKVELRPHYTQVAFLETPKGKRENSLLLNPKIAPFEVNYSEPKTSVHQALGKPCPSFIFPNHNDLDYVKIELDPVSLQKALASVGSIQDTLTRQMVWHTLWEMVMDGKISPQVYAESVLKNTSQEKDTITLSKVLQHLAQPSLQAASVLKFLDGQARSDYQKKIETFVENHLLRAPAGSDLQLIWYRAFLNSAYSEKALAQLKKLLDGKFNLKAFKVDQERRWEIIQTLASRKAPEVASLIKNELEKDPTDFGQKSAIAAESSLPDPSVRKKWAELFIQEAPLLPISKLRVAMRNFHLLGQEALSEAHADFYFENLPKLALRNQIEGNELLKNFAHSMFPSLCDSHIIEKTSQLLESHPNLPADVVKSLKIHRQEEERCIQARLQSKKEG
jgi:aminopeptidase N